MNTLYGMKIADRDLEFIQCELKVRLKKKTVAAYLAQNSEDKEYKAISDYLTSNALCVFPYDYAKEYKIDDISADKDPETGMIRIFYNGMTVFMRKKYTSLFRAKRYFNNILIEQDIRSPHRYTTVDFKPEENDVVLDIGGAEGFFCLDYISKVKEVYIFECDKDWNEALLKTYADFSDKIHIINKSVSDHDDDTSVKIDSFIKEHGLEGESIFIKIDAEGSEPYIIDGAKNLIEFGTQVKFAVCCYHCRNHEEVLSAKFDSNWCITHSDGYMLYYYDYDFYKEPFVRRGVLRICRNTN